MYCNVLYQILQTQQYSIPLVNVPLTITVEVAAPEPVEKCVTKIIKVTEVVCKDIEEKKCFNVAKFEDGKNTIDQVFIEMSNKKFSELSLGDNFSISDSFGAFRNNPLLERNIKERLFSFPQIDVVLGEPNCKQVTLSLPTKSCPVVRAYGH